MNIIIISIKHNNSTACFIFCFSISKAPSSRSHFGFPERCRPGGWLSLFHRQGVWAALNTWSTLPFSAWSQRTTSSGFWFQKWGKQTQKQGKETKLGGRVFLPHIPLITKLCVFYPLFFVVHFSSLQPILTDLAFIISHLENWNYHLLFILSLWSLPLPAIFHIKTYDITVLQGLRVSAPDWLLQLWSHGICASPPALPSKLCSPFSGIVGSCLHTRL